MCRRHHAVAPAQDGGIQQIPLRRGQDTNSGSRAAFEKAAGGEGLDGFSDDRAAGSELTSEIGFARDRIVRSYIPAYDSGAKFLNNMREQIALPIPETKSPYRTLFHGARFFRCGR